MLQSTIRLEIKIQQCHKFLNISPSKLLTVFNFKTTHPHPDILFVIHTVPLQLEILYAFPNPPATSSPSPFRDCAVKSFGRALPFRYASQIRLKLHTAISSLFHFLLCPHTPTCTAYFDTPAAHVRSFLDVIDVARDGG